MYCFSYTFYSDVERALSRFIAKTCGKTHSLFTTDDTNLFPLISCADTTVHAEFNTNLGADSGDTVQVPAYVNALLFRDQIFEEYEYKPKKPKKEESDKNKKGHGQKTPKKEQVKTEAVTSEPENNPDNSDNEKDTSGVGDTETTTEVQEDTKVKLEDLQPPISRPQINSFMRPARLPRSNVYSLPPVCKK